MKKILVASAIVIAASYASAASANNGVYVSGSLGLSVVNTHDAKYDESVSTPFGGDSYTTNFKNKNKSVFGGGIALGYDFNDQFQLPVRAEIAATFRGDAKTTQSIDNEFYADTAKNKMRMDTYMLNGYYDFYNSSAFTPYVTAGVGLANLKYTSSGSEGAGSVKSNNFAWNVGAGVKYAVTPNISVDATYRYIDGGKVSGSETTNFANIFSYTEKLSAKAASNDVMVGVTYKF